MSAARTPIAALRLLSLTAMHAATVEEFQSAKVVHLALPDPGDVFGTLDGKLNLQGSDTTFFGSA